MKQLTAKLEAAKAATERASHAVDDETHSDLMKSVEQQSSVVSKQFLLTLLLTFLWHQQLKAATSPEECAAMASTYDKVGIMCGEWVLPR